MKNVVFAVGILTLLAGCDGSKELNARTEPVLAEVVLLSEITGPGAILQFRDKGQCRYVGELSRDGYAVVSKAQCAGASIKDMQGFVLFDAAPINPGMTFSLYEGAAPKVVRESGGIQERVAGFLSALSQKFEHE